MYTTITKQHKEYENLIKIEFSKEFINSFKNYDDIILVNSNREFKYKKFKDYYIRYFYRNNYLISITYFNYSGEKHKEDGPAQLEYYENGKISNKQYYINDKLHRKDGPAFTHYFEGGRYINTYYLNNKQYSYENYLKEITCIQQ